jgi:hypothetical protein
VSSPLDNSQVHLAEARGFARSLNILLKYAHLYGLEHARTLAQMDAAWAELSGVLSRSGQPGLLLGVAGEELLVDGEPVGSGGSERAFAELLATAKVASLQFTPETTFAAFTRFAFALAAASGPEELGPALKSALAGQSAIRINEVRFVTGDTSTPPLLLLGELATGLPVEKPRRAAEWLYDPQKLLQLISAAEATASGGLKLRPEPGGELEDIENERELVAMLRVLAQLGESASMPGGARANDVLPTLPPGMRAALRHAAARLAGAPPRGDDPILAQVAEHLAVRFALRSWEEGELSIQEIAGLLRRIAREVADLQRILTMHDPRAARPPAGTPSRAERLEDLFWRAVPELAKHRLLRSGDAWCVPPREVAACVERSLNRCDIDAARQVMRQFSLCVTATEEEGRRRAATGLVELAPLFGQVDARLLGTAVRDVAWRLRQEPMPAIRQLLADAFVRLSQEAAACHHYSAYQLSLEALEQIERTLPELGAGLRPRVVTAERVPGFLETALRARDFPPELVSILRRMPEATARTLSERFTRAGRTLERERLVGLAYELGASAAAPLCRQLEYGAPGDAIATVGLLARLTPELLENVLPERVAAWGPQFHDSVVTQLALSGAPHRGRLLLALLDLLDPLAQPQAVDEIGMSGETSAATRLMAIAFAPLGETASLYVQVKAIEALGRLRVAEAAEPLERMVRERTLFRWAYPDEMRTVAAEALAAIDADACRALPAARVLAMASMALPAANEEWARQRRYVRVMPRAPWRGLASSPRLSTTLDITSLSLSGGLATTEKRAAAYRHATLELPLGLRKIKAEVLMQERGPRQVSFEIVNMDLDDRRKLRRFVASQMARQPSPRIVAAS